MQHTTDHDRVILAELPSPDDVIACPTDDGPIAITSQNDDEDDDVFITQDENHDRPNGMDINCNVESYNNNSNQTHDCIVEIQDPLTKSSTESSPKSSTKSSIKTTITSFTKSLTMSSTKSSETPATRSSTNSTTRSSTLTKGEDVINDVEEDDRKSTDENSLSPRKKRIIQISWYVIIAAFLTAFPMFATGIVLGIISYSSRSGSHALRKPAETILSVSIFLLGVGITFLIVHYVRRRCGCWQNKEDEEMKTEFTHDIDDESSMACREPPAS